MSYGANQENGLAIEQFEIATNIASHRNEIWAAYAKWHLENHRYEQALTILSEAENFTFGSDLCYLKAACLAQLGRDFHSELVEGLKRSPKNKNLFFDFAPSSCSKNKKVRGMIRYYTTT